MDPNNKTLYVGDLSKDVTEDLLWLQFSRIGLIDSVHLCKHSETKESLGYAYVNFVNAYDAQKAIDTLNYENLNGKPMRIMWKERDSSKRKSGVGNIIIKNLPEEVNTQMLYDTFLKIGGVLSCKVKEDEEGRSKGIGFVQFEKEEEAQLAIERINGKSLCGREISAEKFQPRIENMSNANDENFTNVFIKNFGDSLNDAKLEEMFSKFGKIKSHIIMSEDDGKSKGFGFVQFEDTSAAKEVVLKLNKTELDYQTLFVGRAMSKKERDEIIQRENSTRHQSVRLYVKNLDDSVNDDYLRNLFSPYGTITGAKIMKFNKDRSKSYGFVSFSSHEEAVRAVTEMNRTTVCNKPLDVALAQSEEDRKTKVAPQIMKNRNTTNQMLQQKSSINIPNYYHLQKDFQTQISPVPLWGSSEAETVVTAHTRTPMYPATKHNRDQTASSSSRQNLSRSFETPAIRSQRPVMQASTGVMCKNVKSANTRPLQSHLSSQNLKNSLESSKVDTLSSTFQYLSMDQDSTLQSSFTERALGPQPTINEDITRKPSTTDQATTSQRSPNQDIENRLLATLAIESQKLPTQQTNPSYPSEAVNDCTQEPLTESILANATPQERREMLGNRLYPSIMEFYPHLAPKITGMLLEMDNDSLLYLLEDPDLIKEKADEAYHLLQAHFLREQDFVFKND